MHHSLINRCTHNDTTYCTSPLSPLGTGQTPDIPSAKRSSCIFLYRRNVYFLDSDGRLSRWEVIFSRRTETVRRRRTNQYVVGVDFVHLTYISTSSPPTKQPQPVLVAVSGAKHTTTPHRPSTPLLQYRQRLLDPERENGSSKLSSQVEGSPRVDSSSDRNEKSLWLLSL